MGGILINNIYLKISYKILYLLALFTMSFSAYSAGGQQISEQECMEMYKNNSLIKNVYDMTSVISYAFLHQDQKKALELIDKASKQESKENKNYTSLIFNIAGNDEYNNILVELLKQGLNPNLRENFSSYGNTLLLSAVANAQNKNIATLLSNSAIKLDLADQYYEYGNTPLHLSIAKGSCEDGVSEQNDCIDKKLILSMIEMAGKNAHEILNKKNKLGYTPLHLALLRNDLEMVSLLIKYGADPTIKTVKGLSCVELLNMKESDSLEILKNVGAIIIEDQKKFTSK